MWCDFLIRKIDSNGLPVKFRAGVCSDRGVFCQSKKAHIMLTSLCFARIVRSTCYRAICAKTDLFDEGLGKIFPPN